MLSPLWLGKDRKQQIAYYISRTTRKTYDVSHLGPESRNYSNNYGRWFLSDCSLPIRWLWKWSIFSRFACEFKIELALGEILNKFSMTLLRDDFDDVITMGFQTFEWLNKSLKVQMNKRLGTFKRTVCFWKVNISFFLNL